MAPRGTGKNLSGGNTSLFALKNGKYVRRKSIEGGGIFGSIMKHFGKNKSRYLKMGSKVGKRILKETKTQLRKPENQKLLRNMTDHLIEKVAGKLDHPPPGIKRRGVSQKGHKRVSGVSSRSHRNRPPLGLRKELLTLTKKEAKKAARKKSRELVNNFSKYIE